MSIRPKDDDDAPGELLERRTINQRVCPSCGAEYVSAASLCPLCADQRRRRLEQEQAAARDRADENRWPPLRIIDLPPWRPRP